MLANVMTRNFMRQARGTPGTCQAMTDPEYDIELIRRIAANEDAALRELYEAYGQRMYAYALHLTQTPAQAEDVVQDTLVTVWKSAGRFRGEGRVIAWLLGIVHNTAMKSLRHPSQPISDVMEETLVASEPLPEEQVYRNEQAQWIRRGLQSLSPKHRAVLELIFYQGMSLNEAADIMGCPVGTIKSRLSYSRQYLQGILSRSSQVEDWQ
ncbi:MAG: sigma-70 family RNA polymerase sigma factor [Anaerolineae bacterium]|nr:sigma-70 family RNA polymerase sigma factor [Anaerolineae bacterium]